MKNKNLFAILAMLVMACLAFAGCNNSSSDDDAAGGGTGGTNPVVETVTITYDANGHGTAPEAATVEVGSKLTKPADPSETGYTFGGWYKEAECTNAWDFDNDTVTAATTLYAKWEVKIAFSVSATDKVKFASGNLYWDGDVFKFEASQIDYRHYSGKTNDAAVIGGSATTTPSGTVGSFFWSKEASTAYASTYSDSGASTGDVFFTNAGETTPNASFTANGETGKWRTLSTDEWNYLLSTRSVNGGTGEGKSYQRATVDGVYGMIVYPDGYTAQTGATSYTAAEWTEMESAGCVFLPAAGYRYGSDVRNAGSSGSYWSSSPHSSYAAGACNVGFYSGYVGAAEANHRDCGYSVRLVCAAE